MSPSAEVCLTDMFLIGFGQQRRFTAQKNNIYQAFHEHTILVRKISSLLVWLHSAVPVIEKGLVALFVFFKTFTIVMPRTQ